MNELYEVREGMVINTFRSGIFPLPPTESTGIKILTPKRILSKIANCTCTSKSRNTSENLLKEIRQVLYPLYQAKEMLKMYTTI